MAKRLEVTDLDFENIKNNLKTLINIGCGDGYHALGLVKNKFFNNNSGYKILVN